jgi:uncharacterized protein YciI
MRKFILLAHGAMDPTPEFQQAHRAWWASLQGHVVDSGNPLLNGRNVTRDGRVAEITAESEPALGYSIIEAETLEDAVTLMSGCPMDMWVYEALPM